MMEAVDTSETSIYFDKTILLTLLVLIINSFHLSHIYLCDVESVSGSWQHAEVGMLLTFQRAILSLSSSLK
jgi:hypothetical protein